MAEQKDKKPFFETGFGKFVMKAGKVVPEVAQAALNFADGNFKAAIGDVRDIGNILRGTATSNPEAQKLLNDFEKMQNDFEAQVMALDDANTDSAREMRKAIAATGKFDWEHFIVTMIFLLSFVGVILTIVFIQIPADKSALYHQMVGMVEGIVGLIAGFHFGSNRSSRRKDETISKMAQK